MHHHPLISRRVSFASLSFHFLSPCPRFLFFSYLYLPRILFYLYIYIYISRSFLTVPSLPVSLRFTPVRHLRFCLFSLRHKYICRVRIFNSWNDLLYNRSAMQFHLCFPVCIVCILPQFFSPCDHSYSPPVSHSLIRGILYTFRTFNIH